MLKVLETNCQILDCLTIQKKKYNCVELKMINIKKVITCSRKYIKSKKRNEYKYIYKYIFKIHG